jgi:hypothetical protein
MSASFITTLGKVLIVIVLLVALLLANLFGIDGPAIMAAITAVLVDP